MRRYDVLCNLIKATIGSPKLGAEIGIWKGQTSARLLRNNPNLHLLMIDPYVAYHAGRKRGPVTSIAKDQETMHKIMVMALKGTHFAKERRTVLVSRSELAATIISDGSLDFIFDDGDHSYEGATGDIAEALRVAKKVVGVHDTNQNYPGPRDAITNLFTHQAGYWVKGCRGIWLCNLD